MGKGQALALLVGQQPGPCCAAGGVGGAEPQPAVMEEFRGSPMPGGAANSLRLRQPARLPQACRQDGDKGCLAHSQPEKSLLWPCSGRRRRKVLLLQTR